MDASRSTAGRILWAYLKNHRLCGLKFEPQSDLSLLPTEFYCERHHLMIRITNPAREDPDSWREELVQFLKFLQAGTTLICFRPEQVILDIDRVLTLILGACRDRDAFWTPAPEQHN